MAYKQINYMYIQKESVRCILIKITCTPLRVHFSIFRSGPLFLNTIIFFFFKLTVISVCVQKSEVAFSCNCRLLTVSALYRYTVLSWTTSNHWPTPSGVISCIYKISSIWWLDFKLLTLTDILEVFSCWLIRFKIVTVICQPKTR